MSQLPSLGSERKVRLSQSNLGVEAEDVALLEAETHPYGAPCICPQYRHSTRVECLSQWSSYQTWNGKAPSIPYRNASIFVTNTWPSRYKDSATTLKTTMATRSLEIRAALCPASLSRGRYIRLHRHRTGIGQIRTRS